MKKALCITIFNEESSIEGLLESILNQTVLPDEVILVDGGSTDLTIEKIHRLQEKYPYLRQRVKVFTFPHLNRPKGRNISIEKAKCEVIVITDAGCVLDKEWFYEITKPFENKDVEVVSGYYAGRPKNVLQACLVPYVLVMPDKVNPLSFLPSTRSMAMKKNVWKQLGGFPEKYRWNEDYVFSKQIQSANIPIFFVKKAIVYWIPRETVWEGWKMFYAFAKGDTQAGIWRLKVQALFIRIMMALCLLLSVLWFNDIFIIMGFLLLCSLYLAGAVMKNYRYINHPLACIFLPLWQVTADSAVSLGSLVGAIDRVLKKI